MSRATFLYFCEANLAVSLTQFLSDFSYTLQADGVTCTQDVATVALCSSLNCSYACMNTSSGPQCLCERGKELDPADNTTCVRKLK